MDQFDDSVYPGRRTAVVEELNTSDEEDEGVEQIEPTEPKAEQDSNPSIGIVDILRFIFLVFIISSGLSYYITSDSIIWGVPTTVVYKAASVAKILCEYCMPTKVP